MFVSLRNRAWNAMKRGVIFLWGFPCFLLPFGMEIQPVLTGTKGCQFVATLTKNGVLRKIPVGCFLYRETLWERDWTLACFKCDIGQILPYLSTDGYFIAFKRELPSWCCDRWAAHRQTIPGGFCGSHCHALECLQNSCLCVWKIMQSLSALPSSLWNIPSDNVQEMLHSPTILRVCLFYC